MYPPFHYQRYYYERKYKLNMQDHLHYKFFIIIIARTRGSFVRNAYTACRLEKLSEKFSLFFGTESNLKHLEWQIVPLDKQSCYWPFLQCPVLFSVADT